MDVLFSAKTKKEAAPILKKLLLFKVENKRAFIFWTVVLTAFQIMLFHRFFSSAKESQAFAFVVPQSVMQAGQLLNKGNTLLSRISCQQLKQQFILNSEFAHYDQKALQLALSPNLPIPKMALTQATAASDFRERIPVGKRFYVLPVSLGALSLVLRVGDRVDVVARFSLQGVGEVAETVLNGVNVVAIGSVLDHEEDSNKDSFAQTEASYLSFYLTPEEIKILSFMKLYGDFTVSLRNPNDTSSAETEPMTFQKFIQTDAIQRIIQKDTFQIVHGTSFKRLAK